MTFPLNKHSLIDSYLINGDHKPNLVSYMRHIKNGAIISIVDNNPFSRCPWVVCVDMKDTRSPQQIHHA
ncbi:10698_t:CDS:2 [Gigaspora rosea]|nr:10698_t:CDS:2 [Gigaspora rosea]